MMSVTFLVVAAAACVANVFAGIANMIAGCFASSEWFPQGAEVLPLFRVQWIVFHVTLGAFLVALGAAGLFATYRIAQSWDVLPRRAVADAAIRRRAFQHWKSGRVAQP